MTSTARLLCLMGSGETAPPMASVHADLMRRVDSPPGRAVMLDTPYGFQENADEIRSRSRRCATRSPPIRSRSPDSTTSLAMRATSSPVREAPPTLFDSGGELKYPS